MTGVTDSKPARSPEPFYFDSDDHKLFGWLHHPIGEPRSRWGVVICNAFGYEALCGYPTVRVFADTAAGVGMPTLRFDYLGTGDSPDIGSEADQIDIWVHDIESAVTELRRRTRVRFVCLMGFRLGALLAIRAASSCEVEALVLVAPVLSGKRYVREARTMRLMALAAFAAPGDFCSYDHAESSTRAMEIAGYTLSAASVATLERIEAPPEIIPGVNSVLIIDRNDVPVAHPWSQMLWERGLGCDYYALPGFVEMMMTAPHLAALPTKMLDTTKQWLARLSPRESRIQSGSDTDPGDSSPTQLMQQVAIFASDNSAAPMITERPVFLSSGSALFGIVTEPSRDEHRHRAVILLNTGADYHIGANRIYVSLARRWARHGYYVLRMDLSGLGDSVPRAGSPENEVFPAGAISDVRLSVSYMRERYRAGDVTLLGLCSGAYHALRAAAEGVPVNRIMMVNPVTYFWKEGTSPKELQVVDALRGIVEYRERMLSVKNWCRLLRGQVNVAYVLRVILRRVTVAVESGIRSLLRTFGVYLSRDLARDLENIAGRGVRMVLIFARGEPGIDILRLEAGSSVEKLKDQLKVRIIEGADHTFSQSDSRRMLEDMLSEELFVRSRMRN